MIFEKEDLAAAEPPAGRYRTKIIAAAESQSRAANEMVWICMVVLDGAHQEKRVFDHFVIGGASERAAQVGRRRLAKVFRSAGLEPKAGVETDVETLKGRVLEIEVESEGGAGKGERRIRVRRYEKARHTTPF